MKITFFILYRIDPFQRNEICRDMGTYGDVSFLAVVASSSDISFLAKAQTMWRGA
jgi:hypothetical protein